jgi:hypothetical protein
MERNRNFCFEEFFSFVPAVPYHFDCIKTQ